MLWANAILACPRPEPEISQHWSHNSRQHKNIVSVTHTGNCVSVVSLTMLIETGLENIYQIDQKNLVWLQSPHRIYIFKKCDLLATLCTSYSKSLFSKRLGLIMSISFFAFFESRNWLKTDCGYPKDKGVTLMTLVTPENPLRYNTPRSALPFSDLAHSRGPRKMSQAPSNIETRMDRPKFVVRVIRGVASLDRQCQLSFCLIKF